MKVILNPNAHVISATQFFSSPEFEIPDDGDNAIKTCAFASKVCYDSSGKDGRANHENQKSILEHRHGSVMEHYYISLYVTGISRAISLEINRHRTFNISQRSTRYVREEDSSIVLDPYYASLYTKHQFKRNADGVNWSATPPSNSTDIKEQQLLRTFLANSQESIYAYEKQVETLITMNPLKLSGFDLRKWARGKARNLLPHALETRAVYTANLRAWRWFIELRSNRHAESEIRRLADTVLSVLRTTAPFYFEDFKQHEVIDSIVEWVPTYSKI